MGTPHDVQVVRTPLPGVGLRLEFVSADGPRVGVIHRQEGGVELFVSHSNDPDLTAASLKLTVSEAATLKELFGGSAFSHELSHLQEAAGGIAVDWLPIEAGTRYVDRRLGDTELRAQTGVSVVTVIREGVAIPSPGPEFVFVAGDVVVAVGTVDALASATVILQSEA
ncbi:MAG: TrkA C-terminal domain-containing protein [Actinomycetota bacterium]|nr:TrkA C-terminal domain-containing protein [Actinomycetota bacterium]